MTNVYATIWVETEIEETGDTEILEEDVILNSVEEVEEALDRLHYLASLGAWVTDLGYEITNIERVRR